MEKCHILFAVESENFAKVGATGCLSEKSSIVIYGQFLRRARWGCRRRKNSQIQLRAVYTRLCKFNEHKLRDIGKIIRALIFTVFGSIFLLGSVFAGQVTFPEDLMCQGGPIHPACIVATQFGDSSRFEPVPIQPLAYNHDVSFDSNTNWVKSIEKYSVFIDYTSYRYLGTYEGKHLVFTEFYDTAGTGRFSTLGFVRRIGNTLVNAGEIDLFKND